MLERTRLRRSLREFEQLFKLVFQANHLILYEKLHECESTWFITQKLENVFRLKQASLGTSR